jgi:hypothetical protein
MFFVFFQLRRKGRVVKGQNASIGDLVGVGRFSLGINYVFGKVNKCSHNFFEDAMKKGTYTTNEDIARRVYRALKTPSDKTRQTDPILAFHFRGKEDYILMRCNKVPEISIKGKDQTAGEVKFFAYSDFKDYDAKEVLFRLQDDISLVELYPKGAIEPLQFESWSQFIKWLDSLDENGIQISLKLPCLVYEAVRNQRPSMQTFIVEAIKRQLKEGE